MRSLKRKGWASSQEVAASLAKAEEGLEYFLRQLETVRFHENGWQEPYESGGSHNRSIISPFF
jgi:hypothetical protein